MIRFPLPRHVIKQSFLDRSFLGVLRLLTVRVGCGPWLAAFYCHCLLCLLSHRGFPEMEGTGKCVSLCGGSESPLQEGCASPEMSFSRLPPPHRQPSSARRPVSQHRSSQPYKEGRGSGDRGLVGFTRGNSEAEHCLIYEALQKPLPRLPLTAGQCSEENISHHHACPARQDRRGDLSRR